MSSIPVITAIGAYGHFADIEKIDDIIINKGCKK